MSYNLVATHCIAQNLGIFGGSRPFYPPTVFVLADLLYKATSLPVFSAEMVWAAIRQALCYAVIVVLFISSIPNRAVNDIQYGSITAIL